MFLCNASARDFSVTVVNGPDNPVPVTMPEQPCCATLKGLKRAHNTIENPEAQTKYDLVTLTGPGTFVGAFVSSEGADKEFISVELIIDGEIIIQEDSWKHYGTGMNPFGFIHTGAGRIYIGFPQPVAFESSLVLRVSRLYSGGNIVGTVIYTK